MNSRLLVSLAILLISAGDSALARDSREADPRADRVFREVQQARRDTGAPPLGRRRALDEAARARARRIAALPHARRFNSGDSLDELLEEHGVRLYRASWQRLDALRGYGDPGSVWVRRWRNSGSPWNRVTGLEIDAIGVATATASDGWVVFVAILLEDLYVPEDLGQLEAAVHDEINRIRDERGLSALDPDPALSAVAREHSRDMARRNYFDHLSPEGRNAEQRLRAAGVAYRRMAENLQSNRGSGDPVATAVAGWMRSRPHREALLDGRYTRTGVGVALDDLGQVYFTQLFVLPPVLLPVDAEAAPGVEP